MNQYRVLEGVHIDNAGKKFEKGDIVESNDNLIAMFPQKFSLVTAPVLAPTHSPRTTAAAGWDDEESSKKPGHKTVAAKRTMRDES
jgi:hypothetical protein